MKKLQSLLNRLPRRKFYWLSRADIIRVRNQLIKVYLGPGEALELAVPKVGWLVNEGRVLVFGGANPQFLFENGNGVEWLFWLKCPPGRDPFWEMQLTDDEEAGPVEPLSFRDERAIIPAQIVKGLSRYFPFLPTRNYIQKNGAFIA